MSGGKGGSSGGGGSTSTTNIKQSKPSPVVLPTSPWEGGGNWQGLGFSMPSNPATMGTPATGQGLTPPAWAAQGSPFAMDWWGKQAPNVGAALLQQQGFGQYAPQTTTPPGTTPPTTPPGTDKCAGLTGSALRACQGGSGLGSTGGKAASKAARDARRPQSMDQLMAQYYGWDSWKGDPYRSSWADHGTQG